MNRPLITERQTAVTYLVETFGEGHVILSGGLVCMEPEAYVRLAKILKAADELAAIADVRLNFVPQALIDYRKLVK